MLLLTAFPSSAQTLRSAIVDGLHALKLHCQELRVEGHEKIEHLALDLSGSKLDFTALPSLRGPLSDGPETIAVHSLEITARPLLIEATPVQISAHAQGATLGSKLTSDGQQILALIAADHGSLEITLAPPDLESLIDSLVRKAVAKHGVEVKKTSVQCRLETPQSLAVKIEVTAKMFIMNATVCIQGRIQINPEMEVQISDLSCTGDGMVAGAANTFLRPHFQTLQGRTFPLGILAGIPIQKIQLESTEGLKLRASFGTAA